MDPEDLIPSNSMLNTLDSLNISNISTMSNTTNQSKSSKLSNVSSYRQINPQTIKNPNDDYCIDWIHCNK